ncbi:hypothetical protein TIFTF001_038764, partial [Ficus carica]
MPRKLLLGFTSLSASLIAMLVSFFGGHTFVLKDELRDGDGGGWRADGSGPCREGEIEAGSRGGKEVEVVLVGKRKWRQVRAGEGGGGRSCRGGRRRQDRTDEGRRRLVHAREVWAHDGLATEVNSGGGGFMAGGRHLGTTTSQTRAGREGMVQPRRPRNSGDSTLQVRCKELWLKHNGARVSDTQREGVG